MEESNISHGFGQIGIGVTLDNRIRFVMAEESSKEDTVFEIEMDIEQAQEIVNLLNDAILVAHQTLSKKHFLN